MSVLSEILVNWLHLTAAMIWLGAVFTGPAVARRLARTERETVKSRIFASFYGAFSPTAWVALCVLAVTGTIKAGHHLEHGIQDLVATAWGQLLSLKLILAVLTIACGAYATYGLAPKAKRSTGGSRFAAERVQIERKLQIAGYTSALLGLGILFIVTLL